MNVKIIVFEGRVPVHKPCNLLQTAPTLIHILQRQKFKLCPTYNMTQNELLYLGNMTQFLQETVT